MARAEDRDFQAQTQRAMGWVCTSNCLALVLGHERTRGILAVGTVAIVPCYSGLDGAGAWLISFMCFLGSCWKDAMEKAACSSCSPVDTQAPVSPFPWEDGPLLSREVPGCCSLAGAATMKSSCPFLMLPVLCRPSGGTFLQGFTGGCRPLEAPNH